MRGEIRSKNISPSPWRATYRSLLTNFVQVSLPCSGCAVNATCDAWVTPLQREARWCLATFAASRVKCPSLSTDFDQTCTACSRLFQSATYDISVAPPQCEARKGRKTLSSSWVKCRPLLNDFDHYCTVCSERVWCFSHIAIMRE
jgi:hypothetical protein